MSDIGHMPKIGTLYAVPDYGPSFNVYFDNKAVAKSKDVLLLIEYNIIPNSFATMKGNVICKFILGCRTVERTMPHSYFWEWFEEVQK